MKTDTTAPQLSESEVNEIETVNQTYRVDWRYPNHRKRVDALIRDWRALKAESAEWERQARLNQKAYGDKMIENAALREQLAQAELAQERLQTAVQLALQGLHERCSEVAALQWFQSEYCFAVKKVRDADESTVFALRKGLPTLTGKQLPTGVDQ